jgi:hypothetical protein
MKVKPKVNNTPEDAAKEIQAGYDEMKKWINAPVRSAAAAEISVTPETIRNYLNGRSLFCAKPDLETAAAILMVLRKLVKDRREKIDRQIKSPLAAIIVAVALILT